MMSLISLISGKIIAGLEKELMNHEPEAQQIAIKEVIQLLEKVISLLQARLIPDEGAQ